MLAGWASVGVLVVLTDYLIGMLFPERWIRGKTPPDDLAALSLATSTIWSVVGGWVTARLAPGKPWAHILALIVWGELMGIISNIATWGLMQTWYAIGLLILWVPAVILGGWLRAGKPRL